MKLTKKEKNILKVLNSVFIDWFLDEKIFNPDIKWCSGDTHYYHQSSLRIDNKYIISKICLNEIDLDHFMEIIYIKQTRQANFYEYKLKSDKITAAKFMAAFQQDLVDY